MIHLKELIAIRIVTRVKPLLVVALYNPPKPGIFGNLSPELFSKLDTLGIDWVLLGDLNARLSFLNDGVEGKDRGLEDILLQNSGTVINILDKTNTYFPYSRNGKSSLLDLCICSPGPASKVEAFQVLENCHMGSDHVPISLTLLVNLPERQDDNINKLRCHSNPIPVGIFTSHEQGNFNFSKANWLKFQSELPINPSKETVNDIELLNSFIINGILTAAEKSIPRSMRKPSKRNFPPEILALIKTRQKARNEWHASKKMVIFGDVTDYHKNLNVASSNVKKAIKEHMNNSWKNFLTILAQIESLVSLSGKK